MKWTAALLVTLAACSGAKPPASNTTRFLFLAHQPLAGSAAQMSDAALLDLGHKACAGLDAHRRSDEIVAEIGGNPLPGSGEFNSYSFIVVDAAQSLCPAHKDEFANPPL